MSTDSSGAKLELVEKPKIVASVLNDLTSNRHEIWSSVCDHIGRQTNLAPNEVKNFFIRILISSFQEADSEHRDALLFMEAVFGRVNIDSIRTVFGHLTLDPCLLLMDPELMFLRFEKPFVFFGRLVGENFVAVKVALEHIMGENGKPDTSRACDIITNHAPVSVAYDCLKCDSDNREFENDIGKKDTMHLYVKLVKAQKADEIRRHRRDSMCALEFCFKAALSDQFKIVLFQLLASLFNVNDTRHCDVELFLNRVFGDDIMATIRDTFRHISKDELLVLMDPELMFVRYERASMFYGCLVAANISALKRAFKQISGENAIPDFSRACEIVPNVGKVSAVDEFLDKYETDIGEQKAVAMHEEDVKEQEAIEKKKGLAFGEQLLKVVKKKGFRKRVRDTYRAENRRTIKKSVSVSRPAVTSDSLALTNDAPNEVSSVNNDPPQPSPEEVARSAEQLRRDELRREKIVMDLLVEESESKRKAEARKVKRKEKRRAKKKAMQVKKCEAKKRQNRDRQLKKEEETRRKAQQLKQQRKKERQKVTQKQQPLDHIALGVPAPTPKLETKVKSTTTSPDTKPQVVQRSLSTQAKSNVSNHHDDHPRKYESVHACRSNEVTEGGKDAEICDVITESTPKNTAADHKPKTGRVTNTWEGSEIAPLACSDNASEMLLDRNVSSFVSERSSSMKLCELKPHMQSWTASEAVVTPEPPLGGTMTVAMARSESAQQHRQWCQVSDVSAGPTATVASVPSTRHSSWSLSHEHANNTRRQTPGQTPAPATMSAGFQSPVSTTQSIVHCSSHSSPQSLFTSESDVESTTTDITPSWPSPESTYIGERPHRVTQIHDPRHSLFSTPIGCACGQSTVTPAGITQTPPVQTALVDVYTSQCDAVAFHVSNGIGADVNDPLLRGTVSDALRFTGGEGNDSDGMIPNTQLKSIAPSPPPPSYSDMAPVYSTAPTPWNSDGVDMSSPVSSPELFPTTSDSLDYVSSVESIDSTSPDTTDSDLLETWYKDWYAVVHESYAKPSTPPPRHTDMPASPLRRLVIECDTKDAPAQYSPPRILKRLNNISEKTPGQYQTQEQGVNFRPLTVVLAPIFPMQVIHPVIVMLPLTIVNSTTTFNFHRPPSTVVSALIPTGPKHGNANPWMAPSNGIGVMPPPGYAQTPRFHTPNPEHQLDYKFTNHDRVVS
eukprot:44716_1